MGTVPGDGKFAVSGLRVFGYGDGEAPSAVKSVTCERLADERMMNVTWDKAEGAEGYIIRFGINPDELHIHYNMKEQTSLTLKCLNRGVDYYLTIDAYNENGTTKGSEIVKVPTKA